MAQIKVEAISRRERSGSAGSPAGVIFARRGENLLPKS